MPRGNRTTSEVQKNTVLSYLPNSCQECWNRPLGSGDNEVSPRSHGIYTSLPVYLVEPDGSFALICYRAQCPDCGHVLAVYKLTCNTRGELRADTRAEFWPEVRKYNLDPKGFLSAILTQSKERYFEVANLPKFVSTRHRAEFYEPKGQESTLFA